MIGFLALATCVACAQPQAPVSERTRAMMTEFGMSLKLPPGFKVRDLDRDMTRFDLAIKPPSGTFELRASFWMKGEQLRQVENLLPQMVLTATLNMAEENQTCEPVDAEPEVVKLFGADRVIQVCFKPGPSSDQKYRAGLMYGLFKRDVGLVLIMALMNKQKPPGEIGPATFALRFVK